MSINAETQLYGLIGDPVSKSLSPFIHNYVFENQGLNKRYMAFRVKSEDLETSLNGMRTLGVGGFNATIPHKIALLEIVDELDPYVQQLKAINTVKIQHGKMKGYNTDGPGMIQALLDHGVALQESKILIVGAGGAARGIALALALKGCDTIGVLNRTEAKAKILVDMINAMDTESKGQVATLKSDLMLYDVVINTTSVGMYPKVDEIPLNLALVRRDSVLVDIVYKPHMTRFLREGKNLGNPIVHGIEMLIYQALIADEIWLDIELDKSKLKEELIALAIEKGLLL